MALQEGSCHASSECGRGSCRHVLHGGRRPVPDDPVSPCADLLAFKGAALAFRCGACVLYRGVLFGAPGRDGPCLAPQMPRGELCLFDSGFRPVVWDVSMMAGTGLDAAAFSFCFSAELIRRGF